MAIKLAFAPLHEPTSSHMNSHHLTASLPTAKKREIEKKI
jgi:hypothetical protein